MPRGDGGDGLVHACGRLAPCVDRRGAYLVAGFALIRVFDGAAHAAAGRHDVVGVLRCTEESCSKTRDDPQIDKQRRVDSVVSALIWRSRS